MTKDEIEEWRDIPGYEGLYQASTYGRIKSYSRTWLSGRWVYRTIPERVMNPSVDRKGYYIIGLRRDGKQKMSKAHRLVAMTFIPNPDNKPQVNHKDTNKKNNYVDNLEWATNGENMQHAHDNKLMNLRVGEKHPQAKLNNKQVLEILNINRPHHEIAKLFGVSRATIQRIKKQIGWKQQPLNNFTINSLNNP